LILELTVVARMGNKQSGGVAKESPASNKKRKWNERAQDEDKRDSKKRPAVKGDGDSVQFTPPPRSKSTSPPTAKDLTTRRRLNGKEVVDVDVVRARIEAKDDARRAYYRRAVREGREEPPIMEHEVLIKTNAIEEEYGPEHDWAKEKGIREHFLPRTKVRTKSQGRQELVDDTAESDDNQLSDNDQMPERQAKIRKRIFGEASGKLYEYYIKALSDGCKRPRLPEGQILDVIGRLLKRFGEKHNWARERSVRWHLEMQQYTRTLKKWILTERERVSRSRRTSWERSKRAAMNLPSRKRRSSGLWQRSCSAA